MISVCPWIGTGRSRSTFVPRGKGPGVRAGAFVFISLDQEGSMQVWILMRRTVWDGRVTSFDVVDEVFSSEIAAERARREKESAAKDQLNADRYSVEGPFEVGG